MALPKLHWRMMVYSELDLSGVENVLNAIYDMYTNNDYIDGETRTPGSGSAWTINRYQDGGTTEALYFTPPSADVSDLRVIIAGQDTVTKSPTVDYDTFTVSDLVYGFNKGSGAFDAWDAALPFTSGAFSGYNGVVDCNSYSYDTIIAYESEEAMAIFLTKQDTSRSQGGFMAGCYIDPISLDSADSESTERTYSGCNTPVSTSSGEIRFDAQYNAFLEQSGSGSRTHYHHRGFDPGAGTKRILGWHLGLSALNNRNVLASQRLIGMPIAFRNASTGNFVGYGRSMYFVSGRQAGNPLYDSNGIVGYPLAQYAGTTSYYDGLLLRA